MNRGIIKSVIGGALIGTAAFFAPFFLIKTVLFFFIIGSIFRMIFWRRMYHWGRPQMYMAMADKVRNMSEEEYTEMKNKMNNWEQDCYHGSCYSRYRKEENTNPKN
jgi:predicted membrane protein